MNENYGSLGFLWQDFKKISFLVVNLILDSTWA